MEGRGVDTVVDNLTLARFLPTIEPILEFHPAVRPQSQMGSWPSRQTGMAGKVESLFQRGV